MRTLFRVMVVTSLLLVTGFSGLRSVEHGRGTRTSVFPSTILLAQQQPKQQEEFTPIDQLPPQEQLPAAPLLVGAYAFVLLMLFGYLLMVSRRLTVIQREVDRLDSDVKRTGRG